MTVLAWLAGGLIVGGGLALLWPRHTHRAVSAASRIHLDRFIASFALAGVPSSWLQTALGALWL
jgi:hypothetical protein